jgi:hypothetical protein
MANNRRKKIKLELLNLKPLKVEEPKVEYYQIFNNENAAIAPN